MAQTEAPQAFCWDCHRTHERFGPCGPDPACGTTGCEAHDGECRDNWAAF
jgi:hypothetical protein